MDNLICIECGKECKLPCSALTRLYNLYNVKRDEQRNDILKVLMQELELIDAEVNNGLKELADQIINRYTHLYFIKEFEIKVGYVSCQEAKQDRSKIINAECIKVKPWMKAYLPYDYIIVFYEPNIFHMTQNQRKILLMHELQHIEVGPKGLKIRLHDTEDFNNIVGEYGLNWNGFDVDVPDILAGENNGTERNKLDTVS